MSDFKKAYTHINEFARIIFGISRDEYAVCDYIHYRCADERMKVAGWCTDTKDMIADFIGISRPGLYKMLDRMLEKGLLRVDEARGYFKATPHYIDTDAHANEAMATAHKCKLSLQKESGKTVNKVYNYRKLCLQYSVSLVTPIKEINLSISKIKEKEGSRNCAPSPSLENQIFHLEAKKEKKEEVAPAAPREFSPAPPVAVTLYEQINGTPTKVAIHEPKAVTTTVIKPKTAKVAPKPRTVEIPETHQAIAPLLTELLSKRPYLTKSDAALQYEMGWLFEKPVDFCREHIQNSLFRSKGVWDSLRFSGCEETYQRWQRTQAAMAAQTQPRTFNQPQQQTASVLPAGIRRFTAGTA